MIAKLPSHTEAEIQDLLDSGDYDDSTDVVVQAVHDLAERRKGLERLRALIRVGIEEYERGEYHEFTAELRKRLRETALRRYEAGERPSPDVCP